MVLAVTAAAFAGPAAAAPQPAASTHLSATASPADTTALSLEQALRVAQQRSQGLVARQAAGQAARERAVAAGSRPDPVLRLGMQNLPIGGPDRFSATRDFMTMRSVSLMQELTRGGKRAARVARFAREADAADAAREVELAALRRDVAMAWLERHYQERLIQLLHRERGEARLQIEAADAAYRARRGSQADAFAARAAAAQFDDRLFEADARLANARISLARWLGEAADRPLAEPPPIGRVSVDLEHLAGVLEHHPEIALMTRREAVARADAEVARQEGYPDWSVEVMYSKRGPAYSDMVSVGVSVPLPFNRANRQDREVAASLARAEELRAEREEATRQHLSEIRRWIQSWRSQLERIAHYGRTLEPLAAERTRAALAAYSGGTSPLDAVLQARRMELETRAERLRIETDAAGVWAQLEYLLPASHALEERRHTLKPAGDAR